MSTLTLQTIEEKNLEESLKLLRDNNELIESEGCFICNEPIKNNIGGFIPKDGKVAPICNSLSCVLKTSYAVMKHNGNGSPIIE